LCGVFSEKNRRCSSLISLASFPEDKQEKVIASPYARTIDYLKRPIRSSWKIAAPITVILFAIVSIIGMKGNIQNPEAPALAMNTKGVSRSFSVSDSVNEILSTLSSEADSDVTLLADANNDVALSRR